MHSFRPARRPDSLSRKIREVRRFVRENYSDPGLTLQSIAAHAGLTRTYLSALYKETTGTNLISYITELRIEKGKSLLREGMKTQDAAARIGYRDSNYFSLLFKKHVGMTPSEFRNLA